jgi:hydroxymethylglutaryl-CoA synthase
MALHVPAPMITLETILEKRIADDPSLERRLRRAIDATEQISIRFPAPWEDPVTMSSQAIASLLSGRETLGAMRYLAVGTETSVDMSKPIAAYAQGALQRSGIDLPREISTFQVQHACAGGTISLTGVGALLSAAGRPDEFGVVACSDVARYTTPSTAEITQGAGSVAMTVETDPDLIQLDLTTIGLASEDVDDFFRPIPSVTARVKGRYSVDCYNEALDAAFLDHARRRGVDPADALRSTDIFVLHVPFYRMAVTGLTKLLERQLGLDHEAADAFLAERTFYEGIEASRHIGNIYSGSVFLALMFSLYNRYRSEGDAIVGKSILLASYGSGNTITVLRGTVAPNAPQVLATWNLQSVLDAAIPAEFPQYEAFVSREVYELEHGPITDGSDVPRGSYYLAGVREDGYREYRFRDE